MTEITVRSEPVYDALMVVREVLAPDLTLAELRLFAMVADRSGLDPFARQIFAVKRRSGGVYRVTFQTGIDGYRSIAARTGEYDGQDEPTYSADCSCERLPKPHPVSSTVRVHRKGMSHPVAATAFWHEYVPEAGQSGNGDQMWRKMPHVMIAKVAEALALRKAFPWDPNRQTGIGSDVYTTDEMAQADAPAPVVTTSVAERVAERAATVGLGVGIPGVGLRYFADAVRDMEPETIRHERESMYPEASGVGGLDDEQRARLLDRLIALRTGAAAAAEDAAEIVGEVTGEILGEQAEVMVDATLNAGPTEVEDDPALANVIPDPEVYVMCLDAFGPPLGNGETCILETGHPGPHQDDNGSRWPSKRGTRR